MHPFILGGEYPRGHLLEFLGSKQAQSGVLWGSREPGCLICTSGGRGGKKAGYFDEASEHGSWYYFGQGQTGDQTFRNAANAKLASGKMSVLLFTTREPTAREVADRGGYGKLFAFKGAFNVAGFEPFVPMEGRRQGDRLIRFHLVPVDGYGALMPNKASSEDEPDNLASLQARLNTQAAGGAPSRLTAQEYRKRSVEVHRYALRRAAGICEGCAHPGPFVDSDGNNFLEVHHLTRLADEGPDAPANVAAICPNCHRRAHCAPDRESFGQRLRQNILSAELNVASGAAR